jgi:hypothetical protein
MLYFLASIILGLGVGVAIVFGRTFLANWAEQSEEGRAKVRELRENLIPERWRRGTGEAENPVRKTKTSGPVNDS